MRLKLKELAERTGVSVSTVSRVLNNRGRIAPETRRRILELARPGNNIRLVLLVVPHGILGWYSISLLNALKLRAAELGYALEITAGEDLASLPEQNFFGVISFDYSNHLASFWGRNYALPLVCLNDIGNPLEGICAVFSDEADGMSQVLNHLVSYNHRRIGLLTCGNPETFANCRRCDVFLAAMERFGLGNHAVIRHSMHEKYEPYGVVKELCESGVSAIINLSETHSLHILHALRVAGVRVPQDLSFVTMELPYVSEFLDPPLTTLEQNYTALAATAFDTLERLVRGDRTSFEQTVPYLFRKRASVTLARN